MAWKCVLHLYFKLCKDIEAGSNKQYPQVVVTKAVTVLETLTSFGRMLSTNRKLEGHLEFGEKGFDISKEVPIILDFWDCI